MRHKRMVGDGSSTGKMCTGGPTLACAMTQMHLHWPLTTLEKILPTHCAPDDWSLTLQFGEDKTGRRPPADHVVSVDICYQQGITFPFLLGLLLINDRSTFPSWRPFGVVILEFVMKSVVNTGWGKAEIGRHAYAVVPFPIIWNVVFFNIFPSIARNNKWSHWSAVFPYNQVKLVLRKVVME